MGDPASQALWEAYMMLRCIWAWLTVQGQGYLRIRGDAQGMLGQLATTKQNHKGSCVALGPSPFLTRSHPHVE